MALALKDRVKETTIVVGTGTATLLGSSIGFQPFSVVGNGNTTYYCISDQFGSNWEVGIGTYTTSGNTLARTTVLSSSNAGALVVFTAGIKDVFVTYPAEKGVWYDASGNVLFTGTTTAANLAYTGTLTGSTGVLNIGSGQVYKDASGNVGIGTTAPQGKFQVLNEGSLATDTDSNTTNTLIAGNNKTATTNQGNLFIYSNSTATDGFGGSIGFGGLYSGSLTAAFGRIAGVRSGGSFAGALTFYSRATDGTMPERMRIDTSGNVGIGTSSPATTLDVVGSTLRLRNGLTANEFYDIGRDGPDGYLKFNGAQTSFVGYKFFNTGVEKMRIDSSGNLLVGTTSVLGGTNKLCLLYDGATSGGLLTQTSSNVTYTAANFLNSSGTSVGSILCTSAATSFVPSSDIRLKTNIIPISNGIERVLKLNPVDYNWISDGSLDNGFIAQELLDLPEFKNRAIPIGKADDGSDLYGVDYMKFVSVLTAAIQELKAIIDTQQEQINSLLGK